MEKDTNRRELTSRPSLDGPANIIQTMLDIHAVIDIHAHHLEGLRTQCATSAELIQQEIRTMEGKLIKLFSRQIVVKSKLYLPEMPPDVQHLPSLRQWLQVVGLSSKSMELICKRISSLEGLQECSEHEIRRTLQDAQASDEEGLRLGRALFNLRRYTEALIQAENRSSGRTTPDMTLYWDSWDHNHNPETSQSGELVRVFNDEEGSTTAPEATTSLPGEPFEPVRPPSPGASAASVNNPNMNQLGEIRYTPPPTPPILKTKGEKIKFPTTPPPRKKHQTALSNTVLNDFPLTKSTSHESQLANRIEHPEAPPVIAGHFRMRRKAHPYWLGRSMETLTPGRRASRQMDHAAARSQDTNISASSGVLTASNAAEWTTNPGLTSPHIASPLRSPPVGIPNNAGNSNSEDEGSYKATLQVPKSPRTPTLQASMGHAISHRFTKTFKMLTTCDLCTKPMFIGLKCKECKYKCHRDCEQKVPPSCGLPLEYIQVFRQYITDGPSTPILQRQGGASPARIGRDRGKMQTSHMPPFTGPDSGSTTSSCSSSTPSSPALLPAVHTPASATRHQQFHFPEVQDDRAHTLDSLPTHSGSSSTSFLTTSLSTLAPGTVSSNASHGFVGNPNVKVTPSVTSLASVAAANTAEDRTVTQKSNDSEKTVSVSGLSGTSSSNSASMDSERTYRVDSQDSQISDGEVGSERLWPRQNSLSLREWDIPYEEMNIDEPIGKGRFGTVYRGRWHGDVAVRVLSMGQLDDEKTLEAFKAEVATFRKTRHENLVLFMGACMKLPSLALVTSMCKGMSLYTHLHLRKDKFSMNKIIIIAQQISQGMGYLHARGIVHKDLKSKNVFLENGKVVITDFGLFSVSKLCSSNRKNGALSVPPGWLCYLASEVIRSLRTEGERSEANDLPFSTASDAYAFGTVWYELLCGEWPFKHLPPEAIIWQVGRGMKQALANLQASKDVKDILMTCWSYKPEDRPEFSKLLKTLERLPKKRLARSPSHPIHLSRSAESVF